jgi:hypothetical protein
MKKTLIVILCTLITLGVFAANISAKQRGIRVTAKSGESLYLYKAYYALVIGVSEYKVWPDLPNAVKDAKEVASALNELNFQVNLLLNPTSEQLNAALNNTAFRIGSEKNQALLIYFAGHGETLELADGTELGYIIPSDCPLKGRDPIGFDNKAVSMKEIEALSLKAKSKHFLMIFDSCFSGSLFNLVRAAPVDITEKSIQPVRQFITAGGAGEQVPDKSVFKVVLLNGIKGDADLNTDGYVTGSELGMHLQDKVVNYTRGGQHPQYGKINNPHLDRGDFIFATKVAKVKAPAEYSLDKKGKVFEELEQLRSEREKLEAERKFLEERKRLEAERQLLEKEKQKLASIPKTGVTSPEAPEGLEGEYHVSGTNPNGSRYNGRAFIQRQENAYKFTWKIGKQTFHGSGTLSANTLNVNWTGGLVTYTVTENGVLNGIWANGKGTETLIPQKQGYTPKAGTVSPSTSQVLPNPGNLALYRSSYGSVYYFSVMGKGSGYLFGTDIYTDDSELAVAAVHAGILSPGQTGTVKVTILPGQSSYSASWRNGVKSRSWGKWDSSYSVAPANY